MIIQTRDEVIVKKGDAVSGNLNFAICDNLGNIVSRVDRGLLFDSLSREELLVEFFETQMAIEKTQVDSTKEMLLKNRSTLEQKIRATYRHI